MKKANNAGVYSFFSLVVYYTCHKQTNNVPYKLDMTHAPLYIEHDTVAHVPHTPCLTMRRDPRAVCVVVCQGRGGALVVCKAQGGLHTYTSLHPRTVERGVSLSFKFC